MLKRIEIHNFKKHKELDLSFSPGTNLIVGKNWAGKSTVLWAVVYACFGPSVVPGGAALVRPLHGKEKPSVRLWLSLKGQPYHVLRSPDRVELHKGESLVASGATAVTSAMEGLLGMPAQTFVLLRYAQQNEAASILTLGAARLGQIVNQITGIDVVDRIIELAAREGQALQKQVDAEPPPDVEAAATAAAAAEKGLEAAVQEVKAVTQELDRLTEQQADLQAISRKYAEQLSAFLEQQEKTVNLRASLARLKDETAELQEVANGELVDLTTLEEKLHLLNVISGRETHAAYYATETRRIQDKLTLEEFDPAELARAKSEYAAAEFRLDREREKLRSVETELGQIRKAQQDNTCPTCRRPFDWYNPAEFEERESFLSKMLEQQHARIASAEAERDPFLGEYYRLQHDEARVKLLKEHGAEYAKLLESAEKDLQKAKAKLLNDHGCDYSEGEADATSALLHATSANNTNIYLARDRLEEKHGIIAATEAELATLAPLSAPSAQAVQEVNEQLAKVTDQLSDASHKVLSANVRLSEARFEATEASKAKVLSEARLASYNALATSLSSHKDLVKFLRRNRDRFTASVWENILSRCSSFVSAATGGQISELSRSPDGHFEYIEQGHRMPVGAASGVQQAVLGVGVRLALTEALGAPGGFVLLDEVGAGAHQDLSLEIVGAIREAQEQTLLVSHLQSDAACADSLIDI